MTPTSLIEASQAGGQADREKRQAAGSSVVAAVLLTSLKLVVGLLTGSLGILAEATHSALDLVAALVTFFAVRISGQPPDERHLYGHGQVENLSALFETLLLLVTCAWIVYKAVERLFFKAVEIEASPWAFAVMGVSIVVDISRSRILYRRVPKRRRAFGRGLQPSPRRSRACAAVTAFRFGSAPAASTSPFTAWPTPACPSPRATGCASR